MDTKAADVAARREARVKKILANSANRIGRIRGEPVAENEEEAGLIGAGEKLAPEVIYPDPEDERDFYVHSAAAPSSGLHGMPGAFDEQQLMEMLNSLQSGEGGMPNGLFGAGGPNDFASFSSGFAASGDMQNNPMFASFFGAQPQAQPKPPDSLPTKILKSKVHIAILAIFTYILIHAAPFSSNVFLLLLLWEVVEMFILKEYETSRSDLVSAACIMAGMSPTKVNIFLKWIQLINKVLRDIAIYLFFFILCHVIHLCIAGRSNATILSSEIR